MSLFASLFKKKRTSNAELEVATGEDWVAREAVRHARKLSLSLPFLPKGVWQILLNDLQAGRIMSPSHGVLINNVHSGFHRQLIFNFNWTAQKEERQKEQRMLKYGARLLQETIAACDGNICYPINIFTENEIRKAIHGVHHLGDGPVSKAYMATYEDRPIFMKCYSGYMAICEDGRIFIRCHSESDDMLFNEITIGLQLNHRNVVKLLGCCFEMEFQILIFELVPNNLYHLRRQSQGPIVPNNLYYLLRQSQGPIAKANSQGPIAWENRLRIAIEIADAVTYLHIAKPRPIIHRDTKSTNILLDEHCRPKLSGFYLSIAIPLGETHVETDTVAGTCGYLDPHYYNTHIVTEKVDVYGFGWLLLELLSGRRPQEITEIEEKTTTVWEKVETTEREKEEELTIEQVWEKVDITEIEEVLATERVLEKVKRHTLIFYANLPIDTRKIEQWMACIELAGRCIDQVQDQRPAMKAVALQLRHIEKHQIP